MEELKKRLVEYGVDMKPTMERFVDDMELYQSCLSAFVTDPAFDQLAQAVKNGDAKEGFEAAHSLKGVSGNLGLTPLYNTVCEIVEPLRAGQALGLERQVQAVQAELEKIKALL